MAFMMKKKRYKFHVDISELELSEVSYSKAILFAKVRQLDGGNFSDVSKRMEVQNHRVQYNARFQVFNRCGTVVTDFDWEAKRELLIQIS